MFSSYPFRFLCDLGVDPDRLGYVITKNPYLLKEDVESMKTRVEYLQSKKFTPEMIVVIVEKNPYWLTNNEGRFMWIRASFYSVLCVILNLVIVEPRNTGPSTTPYFTANIWRRIIQAGVW